jgi:hypothetical protein
VRKKANRDTSAEHEVQTPDLKTPSRIQSNGIGVFGIQIQPSEEVKS